MTDKELETAAINDAFSEELRTHFGTLVDNLTTNNRDALGEYAAGLVIIRKARELALGQV